MSRSTPTLPPRAVFTTEPVYRFTVQQWHEMIDQGTLTADDPVELIEGVPVFKMPKNPPHETGIGLVTDVLSPMLPAHWHLRTQASITLTDGEPEPDGAVTRGRRLDYAERHPGPDDLALVIEVADSTLDRDRGSKLRSYARAGIGCYWIVNLVDRQIEIHNRPDGQAAVPSYRDVQTFSSGQTVELSLDGTVVGMIRVDDLLPPALKR